MCQITSPLERVCRQIADLEYELEQRLCEATGTEKQDALVLLQGRRDMRALAILQAYLRPAPAQIDAAVAGLVE
jgi:hypothetical protein